eukprot:g30800.t1
MADNANEPAVPNGARQDDLTDKLVSDYGLQNEAPNQSEGSGRIAKIIVCVILGSSAVWFCRQNWGQVESALADLRAGFRYSAVSSCDGGLLTVDPEEPARRAPLDEDRVWASGWSVPIPHKVQGDPPKVGFRQGSRRWQRKGA